MDYPIRSGEFRTPGGHPVTMLYRDNTNDWNTLTATLTQDEYNLPTGLSGHAVDVGGYLGSVGIALALDNPDLRVTIIEPVPANFELIVQNLPPNVAGRVGVIQSAVGKDKPVLVSWGYSGSEALEHHAFVGNSTLADDPETASGWDIYQPITLDKLTAQHDLAFLKIDCEGGEWDFLDSPALSKVERIVGEAHAVNGHKGKDIYALLTNTHTVSLTGDGDGTCGFVAVRRA